MDYYIDSKAIQEIIYNSGGMFSYNILDGCTNKLECMKYLCRIYMNIKNEILAELDFYNLYDMCYFLCEKKDLVDSRYRTHQAKLFIKSIRQEPTHILTLIPKFFNSVY